MKLADAALVVGASMRLTRLIISDDIGLWFVRAPAYRWAQRNSPPLPPADSDYAENGWSPTWRQQLVGGLDCPHCSGYWVGVGVLGSYAVVRRRPVLLRLWRFVAGTLTLNTLITTVGGALDYYPED